MPLLTFEITGEIAYGVLEQGSIRRLDNAPGAAPDLKSHLARSAEARAANVAVGEPIALDKVRLLPPVPNPGKILCVATNFHEEGRGVVPPEFPLVFTRFGDSFVGHGETLAKPSVSDRYDFEGELAVVIGRGGHRIPKAQAMAHVGGYTCLNDGSVRDWQKHSSQFTPGKNFYRSGSMGPWLVTPDEIPDPATLTLQTRVNGVVKQAIGMDRMIFGIPWLIAYFSTFTPLSPGDIIATGTPSGFGSTRNPPEFLSAGDTIEIEIDGIGTLRNQVGDG